MKIFTFRNTLLVLAIIATSIACNTKEPIEEVNDMLDGKWEAISLKTDDNIERMTGDITRNSILFQKDSIHTGLMNINITTSLVTMTYEGGTYILSNDGKTLDYGDAEFSVSFTDDLLNLDLKDDTQPFYIQAEKVD